MTTRRARRPRRGACILALFAAAPACGVDVALGGGTTTGTGSATSSGGSGSSPAGETTASSTAGPAPSTTSASSSGADATDGPQVQFDVGAVEYDVPEVEQRCDALDPGGAVSACGTQSPADSFAPDVQWHWSGGDVIATPLVGNLTDDNADGVVDMCDVPDVVVVRSDPASLYEGRIEVLSGDDGHTHVSIPDSVKWTVTPALGDIDGDGAIDIVTSTGDFASTGNLVAFAADGSLKWSTPAAGHDDWGGVALADLDADGGVEILLGDAVYDDAGALLWYRDESISEAEGDYVASLVTPADLDDDGDREVAQHLSHQLADRGRRDLPAAGLSGASLLVPTECASTVERYGACLIVEVHRVTPTTDRAWAHRHAETVSS